MIRVVQVLVSSAMIFVVAQAHAADSSMSKRQMIVQMVDCMKKRMSADKSRSYNEAMKVCKEEMNKESEMPPDALVASETQPKQ